jgi:putative ABC transport system permease protein
MSLWSRLVNAFRGDTLSREILEEFEDHIANAVADGMDVHEARRRFGRTGSTFEASRDARLIPWLDSVRGDTVFAWRQLKKNKITTATAVLSIGLAVGACTAAFRLVDAVLFRPLPVDHPERLFVLGKGLKRPGHNDLLTFDQWAYPLFRQMRTLVKDQAELIAISYVSRLDLTYSSRGQMEKANQQYVSGGMFVSFGLRPALGRLFTEQDDITPGAHPYAVISHGYWQSRFGGDEHIIGRTFRTGSDIYQIIGVVQGPFTGTDTGNMTDIFTPTMMVKNNGIERSDYQWFRTFAKVKAGVSPVSVREGLDAAVHSFIQEGVKTFPAEYKSDIDNYLHQKLVMNSASAGVSSLQADYGRALVVLSVLVGLVLAIACSNVANLMAVNAVARSREMALRISIGAGKRRLLQMVFVESALLSGAAVVLGAAFAWWSAPFVVSMISLPATPTQLALPPDWRVLGFCALIAFAVAMSLSLPAALQVSAVRPVNALKGDATQWSGRLMHGLIALQAGFCFLVLFVGALFVNSFQRLSNQPIGFQPDRVLTLETLTDKPLKAVFWEQVADRLRALPGVGAVGHSEWPLPTGESWNNVVVVNGIPRQTESYLLSTSPTWRNVMGIPLLDGRDFRAADAQPGSAIVNTAFAKEYFGDDHPVGKSFDMVTFAGTHIPYSVVGYVANTRYRNMREPMMPIAYLPFTGDYARGTFIVRTIQNPFSMTAELRQAISEARPDLFVSNVRTQKELIESHTVRERVLAMLAVFFGAVALLLAGPGLYGLLNYTLAQRRRDIGIRMALGAASHSIAIGGRSGYASRGSHRSSRDTSVRVRANLIGWATDRIRSTSDSSVIRRMDFVKYLALLRGINVGGNNIVKMTELRACLECVGHRNVMTYIQSGNLLFESQLKSTDKLCETVEQALSKELLRSPQVVIVSRPQLENVVTKAPVAFGSEPVKYRYDVVFVKAPLRTLELLPTISLKQGVDEAFAANDVLYFRRLISRASQSMLPKLTATSAYKSMTIRNWATTTKLFELMSSR